MRKVDRITIKTDQTLYSALKLLEKTQEKLLICVDKDKRLQGVINDGDIRRALLKGAAMKDGISNYMQKKPLYVTDQCSINDAMRYITNRVSVLPVVGHTSRVVGYHSFKEKEQFIDVKMRNVTIVGMGYVGLTLAIALSDVGFEVNGYDINRGLINILKRGKTHFYERGLQKYMDYLVDRNIKFTTDLEKAYASIYIITVGTPIIKPSMKPNTKFVLQAVSSVGRILESKGLVILRSTVPIGFCREQIIPCLEKESGLKVGKDFFLAYAPERTSEGQALVELGTNPQIIGGYDEKSTELTSRVFNCLTHSTIGVGSLEAAELCKLLDNSFRDHIFAFINQIVPLTERLGLDLCKIVDAVNHGYHRNYIPKPSPGVGGACLSKDPYILNHAFGKRGLNSYLIKNARRINEKGPLRVKNKLKKLLKSVGKDIKHAKIFLIGLAFKGYPETSDMRESTSIWFLNQLPEKRNVCAYDPVVSHNDIARLGIKPVGLKEGFRNADAVVILNNHNSYRDINIFELTKLMKKPAVFIDTWHICEPLDVKRIEGIVYGGVGND